MHSILRLLAACVASGFALIALTATAPAAPPAPPPGLEQAPGQEKKAEQAATPAPDNPGATASAKGSDTVAAATSSSTTSNGISSTSAGVKPSDDTKKHTSCTTGGSMQAPTCTGSNVSTATADSAAGDDHSKRYGNGSTAAQIAVSRGGVAVEIRGPGNSQPHKVCGKNGNWVDVHAAKTYAACGSAKTSTAAQPTVRPTVGTTPFASPVAFSNPAAAAAGSVGPGPAAATSPAAGVAGVTATRSPAGGVAGAFAEIGGIAGATLPLTGFPIWAVISIAVAAIVTGAALRGGGRPLTTRGAV